MNPRLVDVSSLSKEKRDKVIKNICPDCGATLTDFSFLDEKTTGEKTGKFCEKDKTLFKGGTLLID